MAFHDFVEEIQVLGRDLVEKVTNLIHEGNVQRIIIRDTAGNTFIEIPVTVAAVGVIAAPVVAGVGAIAAMVARFTIVCSASNRSRRRMALSLASTRTRRSLPDEMPSRFQALYEAAVLRLGLLS